MSKFKRYTILAIVSSALLLIAMDMTILYTALPGLTYDLGATASEKLWILNGYSLVMAGLLPAMGTLGDRWGHKKIFTFGLLVFAAASLLAAFSPEPYVLVGARILLGIGAAMMMPATLSIIRITFADPRELGVAIGIWGAVASGGAGLGPIIGGFLLEYFHWGAVFLINLPVVLIAVVLTLLYVPNHPGHRDKKWDFPSSIQIMVALVALVYAIKEFARREGSPTFAAIGAIIGLAALVIFIRRQLKSDNPFLDLSLFKINPFAAGFVTALAGTIGQIGAQYLVTQRLQLVEGLSPLHAGLVTVAVPLAAVVAGPIVGSQLHRFDPIQLKSAALLTSAVGMAVYLLQYDAGLAGQIVGLLLFGIGIGVGMTTASHSIMSSAPPHKAGMAASIEEVGYELGGASGVAIIGSMSGFAYTLAMKVPEGLAVPETVKDSLDEALLFAEQLPAQAGEALIEASRAAFDQSFLIVLSACALFLAAASGVVLMIGRRGKRTAVRTSSRR